MIRGAIPEISDRMLSDRLRVLEMEGVVERRVVPETPVRVEYQLTPKGKSLESALGAIATWAERWIPLPAGKGHAAAGPAEAVLPAASSSAVGAEPRPLVGKPRIRPKTANG